MKNLDELLYTIRNVVWEYEELVSNNKHKEAMVLENLIKSLEKKLKEL